MMKLSGVLIPAVLVAAGCAWEENLPDVDLTGTVRIPIEAMTYEITDKTTGSVNEITDLRGLGPVYMGVYPSIQDGLYSYPHPEMGPVLSESEEGNAYPYGGSSVGRYDFACYHMLNCKVVTGRYTSYDDVLDFFANTLGDPVLDSEGIEVTSGAAFQEHCFEVLYMTGDYELSFIDAATDFVVEGDYLVANDVEIPRVNFTENMAIWGWLDVPDRDFEFSTCSSANNNGEYHSYYDEIGYAGTNSSDLLNFPGNYIQAGDWIVETPYLMTDAAQSFDLEIGYQYVE